MSGVCSIPVCIWSVWSSDKSVVYNDSTCHYYCKPTLQTIIFFPVTTVTAESCVINDSGKEHQRIQWEGAGAQTPDPHIWRHQFKSSKRNFWVLVSNFSKNKFQSQFAWYKYYLQNFSSPIVFVIFSIFHLIFILPMFILTQAILSQALLT